MSVEKWIAEIQKLEPVDQVTIASRVLDQLCSSGRFPLSDEAKAEFDRREKLLLDDPTQGQTWDEVKSELGWDEPPSVEPSSGD
jgi:putative addiction module component (TIGR02574 family)